MPKKELGIKLITKLRAILLMEANFNFGNKHIYGVKMLETAQKHDLMLEEISSEKGKMADNGTLS